MRKMVLFDTHAHLIDERFDEDREKLIRAMPSQGIGYLIECSAAEDESIRAVALAHEHAMIYAAVGVHPHAAKEWNEQTKSVLKSLAKQPKVVAIGEAGLDYHYDNSPRDIQKEVFEKQIQLAMEVDLPLIVHSRDAMADTLELLEKYPQQRVLLHCYSGSVETAKRLLQMGAYIAIGGAVTFKNAKKTVEVAKMLPLDRLVIETDSPYLAPVPHRGERNSPEYVRFVAEKIAEIREVDVEVIAEATTANAKRFFGIEN